jgi:hypothetical protein
LKAGVISNLICLIFLPKIDFYFRRAEKSGGAKPPFLVAAPARQTLGTTAEISLEVHQYPYKEIGVTH